MLPSFAVQRYETLVCPRLPGKPYKVENQKVLRALHVSCLSCCVNSLVFLWNLLLVVQAGQCQKEILRQSVWVKRHNRFSSLPAIRLCTPTYSDISRVVPKKLICHSILWGRTHLFQTYMSRMNLSSLARQSSLSYASGSVVPTSPLSVPSHLYSHHTIYHWPLPSPLCANPLCLLLTLAQAAALLPGPIGIPEELLRFVLYGDVKGVPDIWVVKIPHRQHLKMQAMWYAL